jgi:hypothetical protein
MKAPLLDSKVKDLYDQDFFEWTVRNAELLRAGRLAEADLEHITEEIEDMGERERRELRSRLRVLLSHLLKWKFQPSRRGRSWRATIRLQRDDVVLLLRAVAETDLSDDAFPPGCPFSLDQILDPDFFPD